MVWAASEDEKEKQEQEAASTAVPLTPSQQLVGGGTAPAATPAKSAKPGGRPSVFSGLNTYLAQNKPATQALGTHVAGQVGQQASEAQTATQQAEQAFGQASQEGTQTVEAGTLQGILNDPASVAADEAKVEEVASGASGAYGGPMGLIETEAGKAALGQVQEAQQAGEQSQSAAGLQGLSKDAVKKGRRRSAGGAMLDAALLGADPYSQQQLASARSQVEQIQPLWNEATKQAEAARIAGQATTKATKEAVTGALATSRGNFESDLDQRVKDAIAAAEKKGTDLKAALEGIRPTDQIRQELEDKQFLRWVRQAAQGGGQSRQVALKQLADAGFTDRQVELALEFEKSLGKANIPINDPTYNPLFEYGNFFNPDFAFAGEDIAEKDLERLGSSWDILQKSLTAGRFNELSDDQLADLDMSREEWDALIKDISDLEDKELYQAYPANSDAYSSLEPIDLASYFSQLPGAGQINASNIATEEDFLRQAALNLLAEQSENYINEPDSIPEDFADLSQFAAPEATNAVKASTSTLHKLKGPWKKWWKEYQKQGELEDEQESA